MSLIKDFAWLTSSRLIAALLQAVALILVAREAGPSGFGTLSAFMGVIVVAQTVLDFGLPTYITKSRAEQSYVKTANALRIYEYLGCSLGIVLCSISVLFGMAPGYEWWWLLPLGVAGWLERQSDVRLTVALADGDVWKNSVNLVVRRSSAILILLLGINFQLDAVPAFALASVLAALLSWTLSRKLVVLAEAPEKVTRSSFRKVLRDSSAYWANSVGAQIRNLDVLLVTLMGNAVAAGQYGAVSRSIGPLRMVTASLSTVLLPAVIRTKGKQKRTLAWAIAIILTSITGIYIVLMVFSGKIVEAVLGPAYAPATSAFRLVVVGLIFASIISVLTPILQAHGFQAIVGRASLCFSVVSLAGVGIGTWFGGVTGAGAGLAITYALHSVVLICVFVLTSRKKSEVNNA